MAAQAISCGICMHGINPECRNNTQMDGCLFHGRCVERLEADGVCVMCYVQKINDLFNAKVVTVDQIKSMSKCVKKVFARLDTCKLEVILRYYNEDVCDIKDSVYIAKYIGCTKCINLKTFKMLLTNYKIVKEIESYVCISQLLKMAPEDLRNFLISR